MRAGLAGHAECMECATHATADELLMRWVPCALRVLLALGTLSMRCVSDVLPARSAHNTYRMRGVRDMLVMRPIRSMCGTRCLCDAYMNHSKYVWGLACTAQNHMPWDMPNIYICLFRARIAPYALGYALDMYHGLALIALRSCPQPYRIV